MITRQELQKFIENNYTIKKVLAETSYTLSQVRYACKKYDLKLLTSKRKFNVDKNKVKSLIDCGFSINEVANILKVNRRCVYNVLYRNKWSKKKMYPSNRKKRESFTDYKLNIDPSSTLQYTYKNGKTYKIKISDLIENIENIKNIFIF